MSSVQTLSLIIILITLYGIAVGRIPKFRMNRASIALVGAATLLLSGAIDSADAYRAIDMDTIVLLFSMMIINGNLRLSGFFKVLSSKIVNFARTPFQLLTLIIFSSGILSAFFLNDTVVIVYTPLIIEVVKSLNRNPVPYLIAVALSANIGSAMTIIGNPQNMIIGIASGISFVDYLVYQIFPSISGLFVTLILMRLIYKKEFHKTSFEGIKTEEVKPYKPLLIKSTIATLLMILLLFTGMEIPIAAFACASLLLVTRRLKPARVFNEIDWSLLVFFSALFVVTKSIETSGLSHYLSRTVNPYLTGSVFSFSIATVILSNLISNVPAVLLLKPVISVMPNAEQSWLILGMASTFAGNLTLIGSVANLIVAETAKKDNITITFFEYLKSGVIVTTITVAIGIIWFTLIF
ncbi:anion transporter [Melioribacter sp. OK-6-Me]|uniref:anion transporter n=1 Tax=unclassified Melioribacter TaxID=2627329 RepID=UPI003ED91361